MSPERSHTDADVREAVRLILGKVEDWSHPWEKGPCPHDLSAEQGLLSAVMEIKEEALGPLHWPKNENHLAAYRWQSCHEDQMR